MGRQMNWLTHLAGRYARRNIGGMFAELGVESDCSDHSAWSKQLVGAVSFMYHACFVSQVGSDQGACCTELAR